MVIWAVAIAGGFIGVLMAFGLSGHVFYAPTAFFSFGYVADKLVETSAHRVSLVATLGCTLSIWIASALPVEIFWILSR